MQRYERYLVLAALVYLVAVVILGAYFLLAQNRQCSSDGYVLVDGKPTYVNGVPVKCVRLPL